VDEGFIYKCLSCGYIYIKLAGQPIRCSCCDSKEREHTHTVNCADMLEKLLNGEKMIPPNVDYDPRRPLPPEILADAHQEVIHKEIGKGRSAKSTKIYLGDKQTEGWRKLIRGTGKEKNNGDDR
jgi:hypothetical protein